MDIGLLKNAKKKKNFFHVSYPLRLLSSDFCTYKYNLEIPTKIILYYLISIINNYLSLYFSFVVFTNNILHMSMIAHQWSVVLIH